MSYLQPAEFVAKMVDAGESKIHVGRRDTILRGYMAGAILALAVVFAVTITVQTGNSLLGAALFPVGRSARPRCPPAVPGRESEPRAAYHQRPCTTTAGVSLSWTENSRALGHKGRPMNASIGHTTHTSSYAHGL